MKNILIAITLTLSSTSIFAASEIRSSSGASCESSDFQPFEVSAKFGEEDNNYNDLWDDTYGRGNDYGNYVGIQLTYQFGGAKPVDCNNFARKVEREQEAYTSQLEIKVEQLQAQLEKQQQVYSTKVKFR